MLEEVKEDASWNKTKSEVAMTNFDFEETQEEYNY